MRYLFLYLCCVCWGLDGDNLLLEVVTMPQKVANLTQGKWLGQLHHNFIIEGDPGCPDCGLWDGKTADESKMIVALADCVSKMVQYPDSSLDLRWCLIGDDDTYFVLSNVLPVLSQYDYNQPHYLGFGCGGTWIKNKHRLVCRLNSPSRGALYGFANADIAYGGKGMMISLGALKLLGPEGVARCRRELVCGNMDGRVAHCLYNNGTGVQLTDLTSIEITHGYLALHRTNPHESYQKELTKSLNSSEPFCFGRTSQSLSYKSGVMLLGLPSPWFSNMQATITAYSRKIGLREFHPLDIDLVNSRFALLPLEHLKPFHLARVDVYVDFPFDYASLDVIKIENQLERWRRYTRFNTKAVMKHPAYLPLTKTEILEREEVLKQSGYKGKVGPLLPWLLYMQIARTQVVILPLEDPVLRTIRSFYESHVDTLLQKKFEMSFPPSINEALTNKTLLNYWRKLQGLTPANAQFSLYGGLTQSIADLSLPGRQQNPIYHPFWFETKIPHPPHKPQLELDMGINIGSTFAELVPVDLAHYDECMVLLEVVLGWENLPDFAIPANTEPIYERYLAKVSPENMALLKQMNYLDAALYRRAQNFLSVLQGSYQHSTPLLQKIVRERRKLIKSSPPPTPGTPVAPPVALTPAVAPLINPPVYPPVTHVPPKDSVYRKPGFVFSTECRAVFPLPTLQFAPTVEFNGILVQDVSKQAASKPILRFGTKEDFWVQIPRTAEYMSNPHHKQKIELQRTSKGTAERHSPVTGTVIVSDRFRFIYIAVYKAASRTLLDLVFRPEIEARYVNSYELNDDQKTYFTFSFVRDPMTRFLSAYKTLVHRIQIEDPALVENTTHTETNTPVSFHRVAKEPERLHTFIKEIIQNPDGGALVVGMQHMFTQAHSFTSTDPTGFPTLQRDAAVLGLDFLGRVEQLDRDWGQLETLLKLPPAPKPLQVRNRDDESFLAANETSFSLPVKHADLTQEELRAICEFYKQDFICFDFPFPAECTDNPSETGDRGPPLAKGEPAAEPIDKLPLATGGIGPPVATDEPADIATSPTNTSGGVLWVAPRPRRGPSPKPTNSDSLGIAWFGLLFLLLVTGGLLKFVRRKPSLEAARLSRPD